jgi:hypothetical protein
VDDPLAGDQDARWANIMFNTDRENFIPATGGPTHVEQ